MTDDRRIELEVTVVGTPEEVWKAIATGPGISSWYVPHVVEERDGGAARASFGEGLEMQIAGRVAAWEPPRRIVFIGAEHGSTLAFEWVVGARDGGSCVVRLVNSGFGSGEPCDAQYDGMTEGWKMFLLNLQLHLAHFRGQHATSMLPMAMWAGGGDDVWRRPAGSLGIPAAPAMGRRIETGDGCRAWPAPSRARRPAGSHWCSTSPRPARPSSPSREAASTGACRSGPTCTGPRRRPSWRATGPDGRPGSPTRRSRRAEAAPAPALSPPAMARRWRR